MAFQTLDSTILQRAPREFTGVGMFDGFNFSRNQYFHHDISIIQDLWHRRFMDGGHERVQAWFTILLPSLERILSTFSGTFNRGAIQQTSEATETRDNVA